MNEDLKTFIDSKKSDYENGIKKWLGFREERVKQVQEAETKIHEYKTLLEKLVKDEQSLKED